MTTGNTWTPILGKYGEETHPPLTYISIRERSDGWHNLGLSINDLGSCASVTITTGSPRGESYVQQAYFPLDPAGVHELVPSRNLTEPMQEMFARDGEEFIAAVREYARTHPDFMTETELENLGKLADHVAASSTISPEDFDRGSSSARLIKEKGPRADILLATGGPGNQGARVNFSGSSPFTDGHVHLR